MSFGAPEILIILAVIILFFGARKIPELARGIGQGIKEFKNAREEQDELEEEKKSKSQADSGLTSGRDKIVKRKSVTHFFYFRFGFHDGAFILRILQYAVNQFGYSSEFIFAKSACCHGR